MKFPQDPDSESDSEVILKASSQSPEASNSEATFHTLPRSHPLWTEGSVGSAHQVIKGKRPTFVTHQLERTHSLFSIFHPDHLVRERYHTLRERRNSLQSDSLDCPSYAVDLYFRSLVKYRQNHKSLHLLGEVHQNKKDLIYPPKVLQSTYNFLNWSLIHTNLYIFPTKLGETPIQENAHQLTLKVLISTQVQHLEKHIV